MNTSPKPTHPIRYLKFRVVDEGFIVPIGKTKKTYSLAPGTATKLILNPRKSPPPGQGTR
jgi:hypothetical protein